jgi:uncharacterized protein
VYAKLLRLYSKRHYERFGEGMEQTFNDLCRERRDQKRGLFELMDRKHYPIVRRLAFVQLFAISLASVADNAGAGEIMKMNPVGWFEIYVADMERSRAFYEAVLALKFTKLETPEPSVADMLAFPMEHNAPGAAGALVHMQGQQPNGNGTIVYFHCDDCTVEAKRVPASGGKIMKDKFAIGQYGFIALVIDPDGNVIGLHSMK